MSHRFLRGGKSRGSIDGGSEINEKTMDFAVDVGSIESELEL